MEVNRPGMTIQSVIPGSPAVKAGIKPGDRVIAVDGKPVNNAYDYIAAVSEWSHSRTFDIVRGTELLTLTVEFAPRSEEPPNYHEIVSLLEKKDEQAN